uniref:Uncharacterized protein n=1 Tax=Plectus sambesii TaxID=2011161 RepID=A0A914WA14_9BILA
MSVSPVRQSNNTRGEGRVGKATIGTFDQLDERHRLLRKERKARKTILVFASATREAAENGVGEQPQPVGPTNRRVLSGHPSAKGTFPTATTSHRFALGPC